MTSAGAIVSTCPCCGRPFGRSRRTEPTPVDTRTLSDAEVFRYFKRTAPIEDLRFFLRHARLTPELRADGEALLAVGYRDTGGQLSRTDWYRRLTALQDRWRRETADVRHTNNAEPLAEAV
jgi:hypothetical protein